jgi:NAD(P)-dependent dehydrogenase (short-subunit alcohol dehydrogenase family)
MSLIAGKIAAVTGAGSGIGRAISLELAQRGARGVAISDVDEAGLAETERLLAPLPGETLSSAVDVSDREAVEAWAAEVVQRFGVVHQIYNNAGIASGHTVLESQWAEYEKVISINLWGVIHGSKVFLPHLIASGDGHVINVSSLNGYFAQTKLSAYVTTKFGVRGFTETLRTEMLAAGSPVGVSVVHPGGVKTSIATNALARAAEIGIAATEADRRRSQMYNDKLLRMEPARAAQIICDGVERDRPRIRVGNDAVAVDLMVRLFPSLYPRVSILFDRLNGA